MRGLSAPSKLADRPPRARLRGIFSRPDEQTARLDEQTDRNLHPHSAQLSLKIHAVNKFLWLTDDELAERLPRLYWYFVQKDFLEMRVRALLCLLSLSVVGVPAAAAAADCPRHPDALGTSRVLVVDPSEHARIGTMQYRETLPLADHEVVLTFDDGPLPPYSTRVLETLASQCVKATYFLVGRMARAYPDMVRKIYEAGHSVGTHSMSHPYTFNRMAPAKAYAEMDDGIASAAAALGDPDKVAPFFRIPGLIRADVIEKH